MALENRLGINDAAELARVEERLGKARAFRLFSSGLLDSLEPGSLKALSTIHRYLFEEVYDFAGCVRTVNISKGNFRFAQALYLDAAVYMKGIDDSYHYEGYNLYRTEDLGS